MTSEQERALQLVLAALRPLKGTGEPYYTSDDFPDRVGPDEPLREVVKAALLELDVDGSGACRLCQS
jgi:hypothetical protein